MKSNKGLFAEIVKLADKVAAHQKGITTVYLIDGKWQTLDTNRYTVIS